MRKIFQAYPDNSSSLCSISNVNHSTSHASHKSKRRSAAINRLFCVGTWQNSGCASTFPSRRSAGKNVTRLVFLFPWLVLVEIFAGINKERNTVFYPHAKRKNIESHIIQNEKSQRERSGVVAAAAKIINEILHLASVARHSHPCFSLLWQTNEDAMLLQPQISTRRVCHSALFNQSGERIRHISQWI